MAAIDNRASQKAHHTGDLDAMLWGIEKDPLLRQTITVVLILDRGPDREVFLDRLERCSRALPSFRHRLVEVPLRLSTPRWIVDPNFDLSYFPGSRLMRCGTRRPRWRSARGRIRRSSSACLGIRRRR